MSTISLWYSKFKIEKKNFLKKWTRCQDEVRLTTRKKTDSITDHEKLNLAWFWNSFTNFFFYLPFVRLCDIYIINIIIITTTTMTKNTHHYFFIFWWSFFSGFFSLLIMISKNIITHYQKKNEKKVIY